MSKSPFEFKVVIAGAFGVGKTTLIANISSVPVIGTEVPTSGDEAMAKASTTVGLEYGVLEVRTEACDINLLLYGTPGQRRFRFMWDAVAVGADGFVVLVDGSRPETWDEAADTLAYFTESYDATCLVGVNRTTPNSASYVQLCDRLGADYAGSIVACDVSDERSCRDLLVALVEHLIGDDEELVPQNGDHPEHGTSNSRESVDLGAEQVDRSDWALAGGD